MSRVFLLFHIFLDKYTPALELTGEIQIPIYIENCLEIKE
jgi:hypothetical protein